MATTEARILANRMNAEKSTGPKTPEGKERSRQNGLKHGMAGQGVVIPGSDRDEVERRNDALFAELAPRSEMGALMVRQLATLSVRMERSSEQETAAINSRVRNAPLDFDRARSDRAQELIAGLGEDPRSILRQLFRTPEGVEGLIIAWQDLRLDLTQEFRPLWTPGHFEQAANMLGQRVDQTPGSLLEVLSRAILGDFAALTDREGGGLDDDGRRAWARGRMVELIDEELASLEVLVESFDFDLIAQDRDEAGARAKFDPSKERPWPVGTSRRRVGGFTRR